MAITKKKVHSDKTSGVKSLIATFFRFAFRIEFMRPHFYGLHQRIFQPLHLFRGVSKRIVYRGKIVFQLDLEDWIPQNLYFLGEYEEKEIRFLENTLQQGDVFIDIGANMGLFSLMAAELVGESGTVYAFEPFEQNHNDLLGNIRINAARNILAEKLAISTGKGTMDLHYAQKHTNRGMVSAYLTNPDVSETVESISIDQYFDDMDMGRVRVIKIDIEGGEYMALKGMVNLLREKQPFVLLEMNPDILRSARVDETDMEDFFYDLGYRKYFLDTSGALVDHRLPDDDSFNCVFCRPL